MSYFSISDLKSEIYNQLKEYMQKDCVLLNTPDHINIGDQLIWQGEIDFLASLDISPKYTTSLFNFDWREINQETLILLHGGGNFGDVWDDHQTFRLKVIQKYTENKILIFPQSVHYKDFKKLKEDCSIFSKHKNLIICARDYYSFELLKKYCTNKIILVPDMAFCSNYRLENNKKPGKALLMKRTDREISDNIDYKKYKNLIIKDWPTFDNSIENLFLRVIEKVNRVTANKFLKQTDRRDTTFGFGVKRDRIYLVNLGVEFLSQFDFVVSTRLHGHILALLIGLDSIMIDNNYGKNSRFYDTWLKDIPSSKLVSVEEELDAALNHYYGTT